MMNIWSHHRIKHIKTVQFDFKLNFSSFSTWDNKHTTTDHISFYYKQVHVVLTLTVKSDLIFPACSVKNLFFLCSHISPLCFHWLIWLLSSLEEHYGVGHMISRYPSSSLWWTNEKSCTLRGNFVLHVQAINAFVKSQSENSWGTMMRNAGRQNERSQSGRDRGEKRETGFKLHHLFPGVSARMISSVNCNQLL